MSEWRFPAAFGCLVTSWAILLHFTSGLPWWAGFLAGAFYSLGVVWMRHDAKREQRREDERDAWVQKVATAQGVRVALGPLVYVKPPTVGPPYPVTEMTETSGEWLFRRGDA